MKDDGIGTARWSQLSEVIAQHMGLSFPPERHAELVRGVRGAASELGLPDVAACVRQLLARRLDTPLQQVLARHLTVGETYFFRDPPLLEALAREILPDLIRRRRGRDQRLRLWSAGCASGEEAYTLAILLHRLLPDIGDWRIAITGTDINPEALARAATGVYGEWSFRNMPAAVRQAWFERRADGRYAVVPRLRKLVSFQFLNLAQDAQPASAARTEAMDVISCRNVLMYFTRRQVARAAARLHDALAHGGWLAVSPCETSQDLFPQFAAVNFPGAVLYAKHAARPPAVPQPAAGKPGPAASSTPPWQAHAAERARALADAGRLAEALACCDRWLATDKLAPQAHYLRGVVLAEQGRLADAQSALRRAVFLDASFLMAHFALADLARRDGRSAEAARCFANVRRLLEGFQPADPVPHGEGLSAGRLAQILEAFPTGVAAP